MAKKDVRNSKEYGRWKPSKWRPARVSRARKNVVGHAYLVLCCDIGDHCAGSAIAEINGLIQAAISRDAVHAAGLKTIGE